MKATTSVSNVRFVHDGRLGISIGYIIQLETIDVSISFTHKPGPGVTSQASSRIDNFCKRTGRAITSARLKNISATRGPPYTYRISLNKPVEDDREFDKWVRSAIYAVIDRFKDECISRALHGSVTFEGRTNRSVDYQTMQTYEQVDNNTFASAIWNAFIAYPNSFCSRHLFPNSINWLLSFIVENISKA